MKVKLRQGQPIRWASLLSLELMIIISAFLISLFIGRYPLKPKDIVQLILSPSSSQDTYVLFWLIRLPRNIVVLISGAALALAGSVYQSVFRNPLVSSDILGVNSGAAFGAVLAIILFKNALGIAQATAFFGGILAVGLSMAIARTVKNNTTLGLVLAGIIISSMASSLVMLFKYFADPYRQLPTIEYWLMGGFYNADWNKAAIMLMMVIPAAWVILMLRWKLQILTLGDDEALSLGIRVKLVRGVLVIAATVLVAAVISVAGMIGWIGLVAPHIVRLLAGDHGAKNLVASPAIGAFILLLADTIARTVTASEIPVSIITSFIGAPFLAYLLWKAGRIDGP